LIAGTTASGAPISVYTTENGVFAEYKTLNFHTKGVQQMEFTEDGKYLVSVGSGKECTVAIWYYNYL
jgi:WD40 repeat protein